MLELRKATIHKVAEIANVSAMTVTRSFNGSTHIAAKTKTKVLKAAAQIGYRPNLTAQSLRSGKTNSIGLLWSLSGPHDSLGLIRNISIRLMRESYACHIADSLSDPKIIKQCLADFCSRNIDGLIVMLSEPLYKDRVIYNLLREISNVLIVTSELFDCEFDILTLDRVHATEEIIDHFVETGRKKIAFITTSRYNYREFIFFERLKFHNLFYNDDSMMYLEKEEYENEDKIIADVSNSFANYLHKFDKKIPFDALMTSCDEGALAIINYLEEIGYKVPDDIAISGFNNSIMSSHLRPPLASVDRRNEDVAKSVIKMLFNRIKKPNFPLQHELIKMKFIHRKSAG